MVSFIKTYEIIDGFRYHTIASHTFHVVGTPCPKGSKTASVVKSKTPTKTGYRAVMFEQDKKLPQWVAAIKEAGDRTKPRDWSIDENDENTAYSTNIIFRFERPQYHFKSNGQLKEKYKSLKLKKGKPDGDKLQRAVWDALTGLYWPDDAYLPLWGGVKLWADPGRPSGAIIGIGKLRLV